MIKLRGLLFEIGAPDKFTEIVKSVARSKGYTHETYRGDIDANDIKVYSKKERREYGILLLL